MFEQARSGAPLDSPFEGHSLWDLASITPSLARSHILSVFVLAEGLPGGLLHSPAGARASQQGCAGLGAC